MTCRPVKPPLCCALAAALLGALLQFCPPLMAQDGNQANPFDFAPEETAAEAAAVPERPKQVTEVDLNEVEVVKEPGYAPTYKVKNAWRNWVERTAYLVLLDLALIGVLFFIPKTEEYNLIISYFMTGMSFMLTFWTLLCAMVFARLGTGYWLYVLPISAVLGALSYLALMRVKQADVSMTEIKSAFARTAEGGSDDRRLSAVDGTPGNWPEQDFLK